MTINSSTGEIGWTPFSAQTGPEEFTILLTDEAGNFASQEVALTVLVPDLPARPDFYRPSERRTTYGSCRSWCAGE